MKLKKRKVKIVCFFLLTFEVCSKDKDVNETMRIKESSQTTPKDPCDECMV